ncbi:alpha/beta hydrolase-fold protein [Chondrinema litorale]|uniref:alpha/beta hydrolase-fold protein n=1 Tax=Chondrinema litorale TaxID=2994555 RepID=UPI00254296BD|nr:alpha/beta hydrolase-fold protein [Chondrinema litorale]UZR99402.1 alpha/beta hydrolase-fold protein [Chondrinema litorale]
MNCIYPLRSFIIIPFLLSYFNATAQYASNKQQEIVIGSIDTLHSKVLNEPRGIWVHLPENMDNANKYPVIYLLDAPAHFYTATGLLKLLTEWNMPESILVGINTSETRIKDFTPTNVPFHRGHHSETSGGAPEFLEFIKTELQPYIESKYPTENINTIIGHSTGGLFVTYAYLHHPEVFDNYLAIEPSLWWDKEILVKESQAILKKGKHQNEHLYIAVANSDEFDTLAVRKDTTVHTEQIRANFNFRDVLAQHKQQVNFSWDFYNNESHGSVVVPAMYNGLRDLFSWFPFPEMWRFNTPAQYTTEELTEPFYIHYAELSKRLKREMKPDWQFLNDVGFFMLSGHNAPQKALGYLEMNLKYYPDESRTYVALGNFYMQQSEQDKAISYFEKAVSIDGNKEAQSKLKELK